MYFVEPAVTLCRNVRIRHCARSYLVRVVVVKKTYIFSLWIVIYGNKYCFKLTVCRDVYIYLGPIFVVKCYLLRTRLP